VIGSRLRAAQRVHRRLKLQEVLIRGGLALIRIDQLAGGLDQPSHALVAADRILLSHHTSLAGPRTFTSGGYPMSRRTTLADAQAGIGARDS
jgi:hypothetical protein